MLDFFIVLAACIAVAGLVALLSYLLHKVICNLLGL